MIIESQRLKNSYAMVAGCGALGNEVLKNLVLMGVGHLVIVDFDVVEESNLTRSVLFRKADVGRRKVDVACRALKGINPDVDILTIDGDVTCDVGLGVFRRMDMVFGCVDSRWARYCIQRSCLRVGKTWTDGGIISLEGTVRRFRPGCSCYACSLGPEGLRELRLRMPCSGVIRRQEEAGHAPTTPIVASVIGAVMAIEGIKEYLDPKLDDNRMLYYDGETMEVKTPVTEAWDEDCELHETPWAADSDIMMGEVSLDTTASELVGLQLQHPFVDCLVDRTTDERIEVMLPAPRVGEWFAHNPGLRGRLMGDFYQREWTEITDTFPYPDLTLRGMGVPHEEILRIRKDNKVQYITTERWKTSS